MIEEHVLDLLPAYALGCLDEEDDLQVIEHLTTCGVCRAELETYRSLVNELPFAVAESDPPSELKEMILARARKAKSLAPARQSLPWWQRITRLGAVPVWSAMSLVLVLVLGASNLLLWGRLNTLENKPQTDLMTVPLQATSASSGASGMLVISRDGDHGTLVVDGLSALDPAQQYQLWLIRDGKRTSGGVFSVDQQGYGSLWVKSPAPLISYSSFGITIEPAGGSPGPTGKKVLGGDL